MLCNYIYSYRINIHFFVDNIFFLQKLLKIDLNFNEVCNFCNELSPLICCRESFVMHYLPLFVGPVARSVACGALYYSRIMLIIKVVYFDLYHTLLMQYFRGIVTKCVNFHLRFFVILKKLFIKFNKYLVKNDCFVICCMMPREKIHMTENIGSKVMLLCGLHVSIITPILKVKRTLTDYLGFWTCMYIVYSQTSQVNGTLATL